MKRHLICPDSISYLQHMEDSHDTVHKHSSAMFSTECQKQTTEIAKQQPCCHLLLHTTLHPLLKAVSEQQTGSQNVSPGKENYKSHAGATTESSAKLKKKQRKHILESITIKKQWYKFSLENFIFPLKTF